MNSPVRTLAHYLERQRVRDQGDAAKAQNAKIVRSLADGVLVTAWIRGSKHRKPFIILKLLGASSTALAGTRIPETSLQFLAEKVREARSPKLPSPPIRFIGFIQAAKASFPRFGSKINDIIGVSADILKIIDWFSIYRGCNRVLFFHSVYLVSHSRPFEKQNTGGFGYVRIIFGGQKNERC